MGLDMYLSRTTRTKYWAHNGEDSKFEIEVKKGGKEYSTLPITEIVEEIGYWRKSNHIHRWFVENVQANVDNCSPYPLRLEKLLELRDACKIVLEDNTKASKALPTAEGFFFGGVEYDEYYFGALQETVDMIEKAQQTHVEGSHYTYESSW